MKFLVVAHDRTDDEALVRRLAVRERHLAAAQRTVESGNMLTGGAILDQEDRIVGYVSVVSFPDRATFDEWLRNVPYIKNNVWERVEVYPYHVAVGTCAERGVEERARHREAAHPGTPRGEEGREA